MVPRRARRTAANLPMASNWRSSALRSVAGAALCAFLFIRDADHSAG